MNLIQYVLFNIKTNKVQRLSPINFTANDTDSVNNWAFYDTAEDALRWRDMISNEDLRLREVTISVE